MKHKNLISALVIFASLLGCSIADARTVKGNVTSGDEKLSDVIITDGKNFSKTRKDGSFKIKLDKNAKFVYIITPSGYVADWSSGVPQFYQKADKGNSFDFDLIKTGLDYSTYHLIAVGDPQPRTKANCDEFDGKPLEDICQTVKGLEGPAVGVVLGDLCFDVFPLMARWKESIVRTGIPFYTTPGNHDHDRSIENNDYLAVGTYNENFGPENYAFHMGKDIVIMLDNIIYHNRSGYEEGYTAEQLKWVKSLLDLIPAEADIYVVQHSPLNGRTPVSKRKQTIVNKDPMLDILKGHKVTFISGHNHVNGNYIYGPEVMEHNVAAISGSWWSTYLCKDGTPRGYKVFSNTGKGLEWYYKSVGKDKKYQYELIRKGEGELNPDCVIVNVWDYDPQWSIEWLEDGRPMGQMTQVTEFSPQHKAQIREVEERTGKKISSYRKTIKSGHYFAAKPSEAATKITINITDRFGNTWSEDIAL